MASKVSSNTPSGKYPANTNIKPSSAPDVPKPVASQPAPMNKKVPNSNPATSTKPSMGNMTRSGKASKAKMGGC